MSSDLCRLILAIILILPPTIAAEPQQIRVWDDEVWVGWSGVSNAVSEAQLESTPLTFRSGFGGPWALIVNNTSPEPITNVTLSVARAEGVASYSFGATFAGDPDQETYAFWHKVPAGWAKLVPLTMTVQNATEPIPFSMVFLATFERNGEQHVATTTISGTVRPDDSTLIGKLQAPGPTGAWVALGVLVAASVFGRRPNPPATKL